MPQLCRNVFTGEWEERPFITENGRTIIAREVIDYEPAPRREAWRRPMRNKALGCLPKQAAEFNKKASSGVRYCERTGDAIVESRAAYNRELQNRGLFNADAGYGDRADP